MILTGRILGNSIWRKNLRCAGEKKLCFLIGLFCVAVFVLFTAVVARLNLTIFVRNKVDHIVGDLFYMDVKTIP